MKIENLYKKWQGKTVEDYGAYMSPSAMSFISSVKSTINEIAINNGANLIWFTPNHYDFSGMIEKDGKYVYFSREVERNERSINLDAKSCMGGVLIRSAKHFKDYHGGRNYFCNFKTFEENMNHLLKEPDLNF